ncbi:CrcB family protein [Paenibacillus validus]|uniref:fluoride efflux transporter FluC n=1 Tax=Paenibacillus validus TaxID=44253 RepID=UPI000FD749DA|nr:CrcB family protein [Paenibacillus validus]MED4604179.1 CrcB family protein [Paenibacillus validus]MED4609723.1 CrcB family protein [Paenibacillus validus]
MMSNNNMLWNLLWVSVGGFAGAIARYGLSGGIAKRFPRRYLPYGTLTVNAIGSFLLGFLWGHGASETTMLLLGTGFMGAFTTFSTFKLEAEAFFSDGRRNNAWTYLGVSYTLGILLAAVGYAI